MDKFSTKWSEYMDTITKIMTCLDQAEYALALELILANEKNLADNVDFMKAKAVLAIQTGEYKTGIHILNHAKELAPSDSEIYYYLTCAYEKLENNCIDENVIVIDSDNKQPIVYQDDLNLYANRMAVQMLVKEVDAPLVSLVFIAFNNLERLTKPSMECLLKYTQDVDYELILIDNGSTDGTFEYFKSIPYKRKKIYRITKNIGAFYGHSAAKNSCYGRFIRGKYLVNVPNDVLVTKNWLDNMLKCVESDETIGMVVPMTDNVSNLQAVDLKYVDFNDMQKKAAQFNISDSKKWQERMRIIPFLSLQRMVAKTLIGDGDNAFIYNFSDDDYSFQYRRAGYKLMLCGDVFVHHEGSSIVGKNLEAFRNDLEKGRQIFQKKYYGIDAWDDVNNYEINLFELLDLKVKVDHSPVKVLGVDVRCGTPLLEFKNRLKSINEFHPILSAFSRDFKYGLDLKTVCNGQVECDRIEYFSEYFSEHLFDYILLGEAINSYPSPYEVLEHLIAKLSKTGTLLIKLKNNFEARCFINMLHGEYTEHELLTVNLSMIDILQFLKKKNCKIIKYNVTFLNFANEGKQLLENLVRQTAREQDITEVVNKLSVNEFNISIGKNN